MAAWKGNYGGTFLSDLVTRPEFLAYTQEDIYNQCKWIQSGALVRNSALDCRSGGTRVQVPFFKPIDPTETIIESNSTWGGDGTTTGYLNPQKITAGDQIMTILHRGFSYAADDLSKMGTGADPLAAVRGYLTKAINKLRTRVLISQLEGLFDTALAANVYDNSSSTTAGLSDANYLTAASVIGGRALLGERGDELTIIAMHSGLQLLAAGRCADLLHLFPVHRRCDHLGWWWRGLDLRRRRLLHGPPCGGRRHARSR